MCFNVWLYYPINICLNWRIYVCIYQLEYMYQCNRINPTVLAKNVKTKCILRSWELKKMCINVLLYQPINICLYWRIYVCIYQLEYMYQCIRINPTVSAKNVKTKCIFRGSTTWKGDLKCREVKTGFCQKRSMQAGSSETLIGWKSGNTTFVLLWDWMEGAWLWTKYVFGSKIRYSLCFASKRK